MIEIIDENDGIINQFLGDGFMATFGLTDSEHNVCQNGYTAACNILDQLDEMSANKNACHIIEALHLRRSP